MIRALRHVGSGSAEAVSVGARTAAHGRDSAVPLRPARCVLMPRSGPSPCRPEPPSRAEKSLADLYRRCRLEPGVAVRTGAYKCRTRLICRRHLWCDHRRMIVPYEKAVVLDPAPAIDNPLPRGPDLSAECVKR